MRLWADTWVGPYNMEELIIIVGPTAVGKTDLSLSLAEETTK